MAQCCCGKYPNLTEPVILNDIMHEELGPVGNFCGLIMHHDLRDGHRRIADLEAKLAEAKAKLKPTGFHDVDEFYRDEPELTPQEKFIAELQVKLAERKAIIQRADIGEVWFWQGDEYDHPESLACPVIMQAEQVREFVEAEAARDKLLASKERLRLAFVKLRVKLDAAQADLEKREARAYREGFRVMKDIAIKGYWDVFKAADFYELLEKAEPEEI